MTTPPGSSGDPQARAPEYPCEQPAGGVLSWPARGRGRGSIALLHGVTSSAGTWHKVGPVLAAEGWDVIAVDLPGHGAGPRPAARVDNLATLVEATVATLPASVTVLAGHSLGAVVALAAAASHPGLTRGVFAEDPPGQSGVDNTVFAAGVEALAEAVRADRNAYWRQVRDNHPQWDDDDVNQSVAAIEAADAGAIAYALRGGLTWDLPILVSSARVPVMVVAAGAADGSFAGEGGSALRGAEREAVRCLVPEERFIVLEGGHSLHRERAGRLSELLSGFAGTLAPEV